MQSQNSRSSSAALRGPFALDAGTVNDLVVRGQPGAFALGHMDGLGRFCISYVGSANRDLNERIRELIGTAQQFKFRHVASERQAFDAECELFHAFRPAANVLHPSRPKDSGWTCPYCRIGPRLSSVKM